jgi:hypothetical protein
MMSKFLQSLSLTLILTSCFGQSYQKNEGFNLDFERIRNGVPLGWSTFGNSTYSTRLDSMNVHSGRYAVSIEFNGNAHDFCAWEYFIPMRYKGKKITLTGYIKTDNVTNGWAGLWLRVESFRYIWADMRKKNIQGTTGWTKYEISVKLDPDEENQMIMLGGMLVGKGKMWLDNMELFIDGQVVEDLTPIKEKVFPANIYRSTRNSFRNFRCTPC